MKSFNSEKKSSKNEQMCYKEHFNHKNKREYIKNNSFDSPKIEKGCRVSSVSSARDNDHYFSLFPFRGPFYPIHVLTQPCSISGCGFTSISSAAVPAKPATLLAIVSSWNSFGMVTLNQAKEGKNPTQIPPTNHFSLFLLYYSSSRAVAWFGLKYSYTMSGFKTVKTRNKWLGHRRCLCSTAAKSESSLRPQWFFIQSYSDL